MNRRRLAALGEHMETRLVLSPLLGVGDQTPVDDIDGDQTKQAELSEKTEPGRSQPLRQSIPDRATVVRPTSPPTTRTPDADTADTAVVDRPKVVAAEPTVTSRGPVSATVSPGCSTMDTPRSTSTLPASPAKLFQMSSMIKSASSAMP